MSNVTSTLNVCAIRKPYKGRLLFSLNKSENFVSKPMLVKARTNHSVWILFKLPFTELTVSSFNIKEKSSDANTKPSTNFGKRSHINASVGFSSLPVDWPRFAYVQ